MADGKTVGVVGLGLVGEALARRLIEGGGRLATVHSTCDPDQLAALAARVEPRGFALLEVPLSGSSAQIRRGDGVGLLGGAAGALADITDILDVVCPRRFSLGAVGNGSRAKLAVNLVLG